jgi:hypothetical protein
LSSPALTHSRPRCTIRAICRRTEWHAWLLPDVVDDAQQYLNRLPGLRMFGD